MTIKRKRYNSALALYYVKSNFYFLSRDNYFPQIILCKEESIVAELAQHVFDLSIAVDAKQWVAPRLLHINKFSISEMVPAEVAGRVNGRVKEGEHKSAWFHDLMNA
jgi:hypothetical protein